MRQGHYTLKNKDVYEHAAQQGNVRQVYRRTFLLDGELHFGDKVHLISTFIHVSEVRELLENYANEHERPTSQEQASRSGRE